MKVLESIQKSTEFLSRKGVESPRLQSELLLAHVLKMPRMRLYLEFERELSESEMGVYRDCVVRRGQREPLQHILGSVNFCGLELRCTGAALVPRPETEVLAEKGWFFLNQRPPGATALDFGTGTGCLAIALAVRSPTSMVHAVDVSREALALAHENAAAHSLGGRVLFHHGSDLSAVSQPSHFDLIISNPPYIPAGEIPGLQPEVRDHDPRAALDGGPDGLEFYRLLAGSAAHRLKPDGRLMIEFGDGQAEALKNLFANQKWVVADLVHDYNQRPRILDMYPG